MYGNKINDMNQLKVNITCYSQIELGTFEPTIAMKHNCQIIRLRDRGNDILNDVA